VLNHILLIAKILLLHLVLQQLLIIQPQAVFWDLTINYLNRTFGVLGLYMQQLFF